MLMSGFLTPRLMLLSLATVSLASDITNYIHVDPSSTCSSNCGTEQNPYVTIQDALDAVPDDYTAVVLQAGTYTGEGNVNITIHGERRTIQSAIDFTVTIINCENNAFGFSVVLGRLDLIGVTVLNCQAAQWNVTELGLYNNEGQLTYGTNYEDRIGGVLHVENAHVYALGCLFYGNSADLGGAIYLANATADFDSCQVTNNNADIGGGVYAFLATFNFNKTSSITGNTATTGGGGLYWEDSGVTFDVITSVTSNTATNYNGHQIWCSAGSSSFAGYSWLVDEVVYSGSGNFEDRVDTVCEDGCAVSRTDSTNYCLVNHAEKRNVWVDPSQDCDAALACDGREHFPYLTIQEALDVTNSLTTTILLDGTYSGPGNVNLTIYDKAFNLQAYDSSRSMTSVIDCEGNGFGMAFVKGTIDLTGISIINCVGARRNISHLELGNGTAEASDSTNEIGGALWLELTTTTMTNCIFEDNVADVGAGMYCSQGTVFAQSCTFKNNVATMEGGGIYVSAAYLKLDKECIIEGNEAASGGGIFMRGGGQIDVDNGTYLYDNEASGSNGNELYCDKGKISIDDYSIVSAADLEEVLDEYEAGDVVCDKVNCAVEHVLNDQFVNYCDWTPPTSSPTEEDDSSSGNSGNNGNSGNTGNTDDDDGDITDIGCRKRVAMMMLYMLCGVFFFCVI